MTRIWDLRQTLEIPDELLYKGASSLAAEADEDIRHIMDF